MALHRSSLGRRGSKNNDSQKDDEEMDNNGYVQVLVKPLEQGRYSFLLNWLGVSEGNLLQSHASAVTGSIVLLIASVVVYQLFRCDMGFLFQRLCGILVPMFTMVCAFYWLSVYLRKTWSTTSVYLLFASCFVGETFAQVVLCRWGTSNDDYGEGMEISFVTQPLINFVVLLAVCSASVFSSLDTSHSAVVISLVSFSRFLACSSLNDLPNWFRPYIGYACGLAGFIVSKYMETVLKPPINNFMTHDGKIPVIKRRRSSSSGTHTFSAHRSARRTSLPALIPKNQSSSASYDTAIIGEAHGLITDMLADTSLPPHVVSGLRAVGNLLKPSDNHSSIRQTRVSPLVSLTESTSYGSDSEENPYTGERPSSLPKRLRRSLPPSLIRRMSTSTWTTTTSATGMPTLELEPCRVRSSSFRHSRDTTPGSSPVESRSNSPSPSSPTVILTIPKSRSFSLAATQGTQPGTASHLKRPTRKSMTPGVNYESSTMSGSPQLKGDKISPLVKGELEQLDDRLRVSAMSKDHFSTIRKNVTSDYESCNDSPSSSDHSDNMLTSDELSGSPPKKVISVKGDLSQQAQLTRVRMMQDFVPIIDHPSYTEEILRDVRVRQDDDDSREAAADDEDDGDDDEEESTQEVIPQEKNTSQKDSTSVSSSHPHKTTSTSSSSESFVCISATKTDSTDLHSVDKVLCVISDIDNSPLLQIQCLNRWDFPIFDLASISKETILSKVAYKLFMEVGLFETFRIPVAPFLQYFHAVEMGYRDMPYHNRVHATDVLHGVYYLTSQPIPGFTQVSTTDIFGRQGSSSESGLNTFRSKLKSQRQDGEAVERSPPQYRANSFTADDSYGIMGGNFPALELMSLFTAAAMHDYDHPGRTNAFLVATHAPQAVLYNDRSVLENHHAAAAWNLFLSNPDFNFLSGLDQAEFKRFRYLVIEAILATDLKRHFEILAEFNAKVNDEDAVGIDWTSESDRMLVAQMVVKLADINGPAKSKDLHTNWTMRISEEFYEQGDEEARLGMPISPYMDRRNPQLAKLQQTFINHLVAPLCNTMVTAGLLPGIWVEDENEEGEESDGEKTESPQKDTEDENETDTETASPDPKVVKKHRRIDCTLTKNMKDNHEMWVAIIQEQEKEKALTEQMESIQQQESETKPTSEMEPIKEESESPTQASPDSLDSTDSNQSQPTTQTDIPEEVMEEVADTKSGDNT